MLSRLPHQAELTVPARVDVVAVVGTGEAAGVGWPVGVPAVDELGCSLPAGRRRELAHEVGAGARAAAAAGLSVDRADVHGAAGAVVGDVAVDRVGGVVGSKGSDYDRVTL